MSNPYFGLKEFTNNYNNVPQYTRGLVNRHMNGFYDKPAGAPLRGLDNGYGYPVNENPTDYTRADAWHGEFAGPNPDHPMYSAEEMARGVRRLYPDMDTPYVYGEVVNLKTRPNVATPARRNGGNMNYTGYYQEGGAVEGGAPDMVAIVQAAISGDKGAMDMLERGAPEVADVVKAALAGDENAVSAIEQLLSESASPESMKRGGCVKRAKKHQMGSKVRKAASGCPCMLKKVGGRLIEVDGCTGVPIARNGMQVQEVPNTHVSVLYENDPMLYTHDADEYGVKPIYAPIQKPGRVSALVVRSNLGNPLLSQRPYTLDVNDYYQNLPYLPYRDPREQANSARRSYYDIVYAN